ncbi:hypothetical protein [Lewinella sp. W8]|uniref:hypothetical protein n=1 Tax=Lewinella sp. W8 TaxID=2528208 RepID=UPI001067337D|nr:hypothetical protein [Lewinella sp. W8]MTB50764.1 hypothetical protein [Lewinella sp. W8]
MIQRIRHHFLTRYLAFGLGVLGWIQFLEIYLAIALASDLPPLRMMFFWGSTLSFTGFIFLVLGVLRHFRSNPSWPKLWWGRSGLLLASIAAIFGVQMGSIAPFSGGFVAYPPLTVMPAATEHWTLNGAYLLLMIFGGILAWWTSRKN